MATEMFQPESAAAKLAAAQAARNAIIVAASRGEATSAADMRAAEQAVRDAETDVTLAAAIGVHTKAERERAQIAALADAAQKIGARTAELVAEDIEAAAALDQALAAAQAAARRQADVLRALAAQDAAAHFHNQSLKDVALTNETMAALHTSQWPKAKTISTYPVAPGPELDAMLYDPRRKAVVLQSAETIALARHGRFAAAAA